MTTSDSDYGARYRKTVMVSGRRTSISVEVEMWKTVDFICKCEKLLLPDVLTAIDRRRESASLASAIRSVCIFYWKAMADYVQSRPPLFEAWPKNSLAEPQPSFTLSLDELEARFPIPPKGIGLFDSVLKAFSDRRRVCLLALAAENKSAG